MRIKMPAVRIAQVDADGADPENHQDILTCGACQKPFALSDIVCFIQHKIASCNKENFGQCFTTNPTSDRDRDNDDGAIPLSTINTRRPSISAPISGKKSSGNRIHTPPPASPRLPAPGDLCVDGAASSTPKRRTSGSPLTTSSSLEDGEDIKPNIKRERIESSSSPEENSQIKKSRAEVADAESNTTHSEPSNYVCSTCKARLHSAWRLVQHVQHSHGIKIYVESFPSSKSHNNNHSSSSASSSSSGYSSGSGPPPPNLRHHLLPPPDLHNPFGVGGLLRLPLPSLNHGPVPPAPLFSRPEHHYRIDQLVNEQFRHHSLNLAAAAAAVAASGVPPPHPSFPASADTASSSVSNVSLRDRTSSNQPLSLEPQLDFYSQRLRQLAGTTSPGVAQANSPSPRKLSPPFASPSPSQVQPTTISNNLSSGSSTNSNNNNNSTTSGASSRSRPPSASPPSKDDCNQALISTPRSASTPPGKPGSPRNINITSDSLHTCDYCGKKFQFKNTLEAHLQSHAGEQLFKCKVCDHACNHKSKLKRHMKIHQTAEDKNSNAGSVETLDGEDSEEDEELDDEEDEDEELEQDEEEAEDLSVPSQSLPKNALPSASLVGELMDKFGLSNIAQYSEAYKQALQESSNTSLKMQLANKDRDNNNSTSLNNHMRLREDFAKSILPVPPQQSLPLFPSFNDSYETRRLKLDLERNDWWLSGLPRESKGLPGPSALLPNQLIKKESRRNDTCEYCGKVFKNCSNLTVHRRSHTGEKPYKCELCSYACAQSSKLTRHMKTHGRLGKDVYRCRFCEMPFSVPSTLEKHMRKCVVNQGKGHLLSTMPMLSGDEDSSTSITSKDAT